MQAISYALPLTRGIQAARLAASGASVAEVWPLLAGEITIEMAFALAGFAVSQWFET